MAKLGGSRSADRGESSHALRDRKSGQEEEAEGREDDSEGDRRPREQRLPGADEQHARRDEATDPKRGERHIRRKRNAAILVMKVRRKSTPATAQSFYLDSCELLRATSRRLIFSDVGPRFKRARARSRSTRSALWKPRRRSSSNTSPSDLPLTARESDGCRPCGQRRRDRWPVRPRGCRAGSLRRPYAAALITRLGCPAGQVPEVRREVSGHALSGLVGRHGSHPMRGPRSHAEESGPAWIRTTNGL
jgi:hypothetical protein